MNMAFQPSLPLVTAAPETVTSSPLTEMIALCDRLILERDAIHPADCAPPCTWITYRKARGHWVKRWETGRHINGKKQVKEEIFPGGPAAREDWREMEQNRDRRAELVATIYELTARIERLQTLFPDWSV